MAMCFCDSCPSVQSSGFMMQLSSYFAGGVSGVQGIDEVSMANIRPGGVRLWIAFSWAYAIAYSMLYEISLEYATFANHRRDYLRDEENNTKLTPASQFQYSIRVDNIPPEFRTAQKLKKFFEEHPLLNATETVLCATIVRVTPALDRAIALRDAVVAQWEEAVAEYEASEQKKRPLLTLIDGKLMFI